MTIIDCLKCYQCHRIDNKVFCPFFDLNPCHRGLHKLDGPSELPKKTKVEPKKLKLEYSARTIGTVCYENRKYIFERLKQGETEYGIAKHIGVNHGQVVRFLDGVMRINGITLSDLRKFEIEE